MLLFLCIWLCLDSSVYSGTVHLSELVPNTTLAMQAFTIFIIDSYNHYHCFQQSLSYITRSLSLFLKIFIIALKIFFIDFKIFFIIVSYNLYNCLLQSIPWITRSLSLFSTIFIIVSCNLYHCLQYLHHCFYNLYHCFLQSL